MLTWMKWSDLFAQVECKGHSELKNLNFSIGLSDFPAVYPLFYNIALKQEETVAIFHMWLGAQWVTLIVGGHLETVVPA